mmetsp:Transcript_51090/g.134961  ORF Transcript_51090/g.134961 Transcript_51090/m.134961 type:complete len:262 (+) Transcript_51090:261-1046(+)
MVAAHQMFAAPLPPDWTEQIDESSGRVYFFNSVTSEALWVHPQMAVFQEIIADVQSWRSDDTLETIFARSDAHLRKAHKLAVEAISQWSCHDAPPGSLQGPEEAPEFGDAATFYFNGATGESRWTDPRQSAEFDLRQRQKILSACIVSHTQASAKIAPHSQSARSSDSSGDESDQGGVQAFVQNLWESLGALPVLRQSEQASASPPSADRRPYHLPAPMAAGDDTRTDTVRSSMSYLTARSQAESCIEDSSRGPSKQSPLL